MNTSRASVLIYVLIFGAIAGYCIAGLVQLGTTQLKAVRAQFARETAFQIAETGIDYYRWRLALNPNDYVLHPGPITNNVKDKRGVIIGSYTLTITPPPTGSTRIKVQSVGRSSASPTTPRTIIVDLARQSIARFSIVANDVMRFGEGTDVYGPLHSNNGIRFDGVAHNTITSAVASYDDPDHSGSAEYGVHTHVSPVDPLPPNTPPTRADVFKGGRQFPVPAIDFTDFTSNLASLKSAAQNGGFYRASSGSRGYYVQLKTDDTFALYKVTSLVNTNGSCTDAQTQEGWGSWTIQNKTLLGTYSFPGNGILFFEDDVFIDGTINTARLTIVAARLPDNASQRKNIIINNNLRYTNTNGTDALGLIAQNNVTIGMQSAQSLRIDAALVAQYGRVGRYYYGTGCSPYHTRQDITLFGMIATYGRYGFAYTDSTGYQTRNIYYDGNLLYAPPPLFPVIADTYTLLSWDEL